MIQARQLKTTVLFDNSSGASGNIHLNDDVNNYKHIEIFFRSSDNQHSSVKIKSSVPIVSLLMANMTTGGAWLKLAVYSFANSNMYLASNNSGQVVISSNPGYQIGNYIFITKVLGYK